MTRYWGFRTDPHRLATIVAALQSAELRQGWGYRPDLDLDLLGELVAQRGRDALDGEQQAAWRRCQRMWPGHWDPIRPGDVVLLPKVPQTGTFTLARIDGPYHFEQHRDGDLGHILPATVLRWEIPNSNVHVSSGIQRTLRQRSPIWEITHLASDLEALLAQDAGQLASRDSDLERLERLRVELIAQLGTSLRHAFGGNQFEAPVRRLLEALYRRGTVDVTAGPAERGADYVVDDVDPFGFERRIVFQLKAWDGVVDDLGVLDQLRTAVETRDAQEAYLLTTAAGESPAFATARDELERELGVPIRFVGGELLATLFLEHLTGLVAS